MNRTIHSARRIIVLLSLAALMAMSTGCGLKNIAVDCSEPVFSEQDGSVVQSDRPRSRTKPSRPYTVMGKTYHPLHSADGFVQVGTASWYGKDFHGKKTANGEVYNMYSLTAAHKTLPLGVRMKVTNLENGKSVIVDVNDRGPFVGTRVIDLSYAAAKAIGMHHKGLAKVRITTVLDVPAPAGKTRYAKKSSASPVKVASKTVGKAVSKPVATKPGRAYYVQVGAFSKKQNARTVFTRLVKSGFEAEVRAVKRGSKELYHVRAGEFARKDSARKALARIKKAYPASYITASN